MPDVLSEAGVSWKCYNPYGSLYQPGSSAFISKNMLLYFDQYANADPSSAAYQNAFSYYGPNVDGGLTATNPNIDDFTADVANGTLPQVSWIISPDSYDEHPPAPAQLGEWYTQQILDTLTSNPDIWASTVLFIMYDENDGFFDHVPPPTAAAGTAGEYLTNQSSQTLSQSGGIAGPIGLGVRVPMLVVSPFSAGGWVCSRRLRPHLAAAVPGLAVQRHRAERLEWRAVTVGNLMSTLPVLEPAGLQGAEDRGGVRQRVGPSDQQRVHPIRFSSSTPTTGRTRYPMKQKMPKQASGSLKTDTDLSGRHTLRPCLIRAAPRW